MGHQDHPAHHLRDEEEPERILTPVEDGLLAGLCQSRFVVSEAGPLSLLADPLLPAERAQIAGAVESRRREFTLGRHLARRALRRLGISGYPLLASEDRDPQWPAHLVGSITHTDAGAGGFCGVAVADRRHVQAIGIDADSAEPLPVSLWDRVMTEGERDRLVPDGHAGLWARLTFAAKEALYKAVFPHGRRFLEFRDVEIEPGPGPDRFQARLLRDGGSVFAAGRCYPGRYTVVAGLVLCAVTIACDGEQRGGH